MLQAFFNVFVFWFFSDLKSFNDLIKQTIGYFKTRRVEQMLRIHDSPQYLKRLYEQFVKKQKAIERCNRNKADLVVKQQEMANEEKELNAKLKLILQKTKELQRYVSVSMLSFCLFFCLKKGFFFRYARICRKSTMECGLILWER